MPYRERIKPRVIVRLLPNMQRMTVGQFRSCSDADAYLQLIRQLIPNTKFAVMFNPSLTPSYSGDSTAEGFLMRKT